MKHLNFLLKSGSQSRSHSIVTLASTVGSPSAHRRGTMLKHVAFLLLFLFAGFGNAWGVNVNISDYATAHSWTGSGGGPYTSVSIDANVTATVSGGTNTGKYYTDWRLYQTESASITIATSSGTISSITITYGNSNGGSLYDGSTAKSSGTAISVSGSSKTLTVGSTTGKTNGQVRITAISVTYTPAASCSTNPTVGNIMNDVSSITASGATFTTSAGVSAGTNCTLSEVGFVYGTSTNPTITTGTKATIDNYTSGVLNKSVTGLSTGTTYYVRAFATNGHGTTYSDQKSFTPVLPNYTVTFNAGTGTCGTSTFTQTAQTRSVTLPSATPMSTCTGWSFAGWCTSSAGSEDENSTSPGTILTGSYEPTSDVTLYAVYTRSGSGGTYYQSVSANNVTAGTYVIAALRSESSSDYYYPATGGVNSGDMVVTDGENNRFSLTDGKFTTIPTGGIEFTFTGNNSDGFSISNGTGNLYFTAASNRKLDFQANNTTKWKVYDKETPLNTNGVYLQYYDGASAYYTITENSTAAGAIRGYSNNTKYRAIYLFKKVSSAYYMTSLTCCQTLGQINGSVIVSQTPTSVQLSWNAVQGAEKYQVKVPGSTSHNDWTDATSGVTVTGLACGTAHTAYFRAIDTNGSHCSEGPESTLAIPAQSWTVTSSGVTNATPNTAFPETTCEGFSRTISAVAGYELPESITVTGASYTWNNGALTISNVTADVTITITGQEISDPEITAAPASVTFDAVDQGANVPAATTFTITGANLTGNLSMTSAQESDPFNWTITSGNLTKDANDEVHATITVTPKSGITDEAGTKQASITISGGGASNVVVPISLTVQPRYTVSFSTGTGNDPIEPIKEETYDAGITLPAGPTPACSIDSWAFAGWSETEVDSKTSTTPTLLPNETYHPSGNVTLYAVYSKDEAGGTSEKTANVTISDYATAHEWGNGTKYTSVTLDDNITLTASDKTGTGNTGKYYNTNHDWRFYQSESATLTISASNSCTLKSATFTYGTNNNTDVLKDGNTEVASTEEYEIEGTPTSKSFSVGNSSTATNGQVKFTAISVTYNKPAVTTYYWSAPVCCTDKVTITKADNPANGTFIIDKDGDQSTCEAAVTVIVTPTPGEHCRVNEVTASNSTSISEPDEDGKYTITYAKNTNASSTINVSFVTKTQYKVTWNVNGNESTKTDVYDGEQPVFPSEPSSCDDEGGSEAFYGWATAAWTGKKALNEVTAHIYTSVNDMPAVTGAVTYYAVFAKLNPGSQQTLINEGFDNTSSSDATGAFDGSTFANFSGLTDKAYKSQYGGVKLGSGSGAGYITSKDLDLSSAFSVSIDACKYGTDAGDIVVTIDEGGEGKVQTIENSSLDAQGTFKTFKLDFAAATATSTIEISTSEKRAYIDNVVVKAGEPASYSEYMTTCCTKYAVNIANGITNGTVTPSPASACEGATITLTFTPSPAYHLDSWSVNGTAQNVNANTFTMLGENVTVSATFAHDPCKNLAAPTLNGDIVKTYNSATINWNAVVKTTGDLDVAENGVTGYLVTVTKNGAANPIFSGNVNALTKALSELEAETQYNYSIMAVGDGTDYCATGNGVLEGNFTTNALPTAHLTLIDINGEHASSGDYTILTPFNLPTSAAACSKTFIGWDSDEDCTTAPDYAKGASFTFANTTGVTLYAVYANNVGGDESSVEFNAESYASANSWENGVAYTTFTISGVTFTANGGGNNGKYYTSNHSWRLYNGGSISITASGVTISSVSSNPSVSFSETSGTFTSSFTATTEFKSITVNVIAPDTYENYSTACAAAPEATADADDVAELVNVDAAGASGTIAMTYSHVNTSNLAVDLFNDAECSEAFTGSWLTASINEDKDIAYTIAENTTYAARTAYIKLTAPETTGATAPAVVVIPVSQEGKAKVFASLAELVAADIPSGEVVTVSFSTILIKEIYATNAGDRKGVYLDVKAANDDYIEIFYASEPYVTTDWVKNGYLSATSLEATWTHYTQYSNDVWELIPTKTGFDWEQDLVYADPKAVSSVVVSGEPSKKAYVDGEKFKPAGLTVTVNYTIGDPEVIDAAEADWTYETTNVLALNQTSINVKATYNSVTSENFFAVTGLTVGEIQLKTVEQFIAAGTADMRCYLEGIVSDIETGNKLKYGNFNLTDASGTIYIYGCLDQNGVAEQFESLGVNNGDKIKVLAEDYEYYNSKNEAKNVQFVSKTPAATISIDNIDMETGDELALSSIVATITPAAAQSATINYEVTEGTAVSISEGKIIAAAAGEATITASIAEGVGYLAANTTFTVTVSAPDPATLISPIGGKFIINQYGDSAVFSRGSLQYQQSTNTWRCADNQYDWMGVDNNLQMGNATYNGWVDLFCWSIGAENNFGATSAYDPTLYNNKAFEDWGGLFTGDWSTLSINEWTYMLYDRPNADDLWGMALIGDTLGMVLLPGDWEAPSGVTFVAGAMPTTDMWYDDDCQDPDVKDHWRINPNNMPNNKFTTAEWEILEASGAVFFPYGGRRSGGYGNHTNKDNVEIPGEYKYVYYENYQGAYWTSTVRNAAEGKAYWLPMMCNGCIDDNENWGRGSHGWWENGRYGHLVRLAHIIPRQYTVTYDANGAEGTVPTDENTYIAGAEITVLGQGTLKKAHYRFAGWKLGNTTYAEDDVVATPKSANDVVFVAQWEELPVWAYTYTSNLDDVKNGGSVVEFNGDDTEYNAIKAGTGKVAGEATITIPAKATKVHFHAYGWNGESVQLSITAPTGVTLNPETPISINSNTGIADNSPFTLSETADPEHDAYYAVSLSGNDDEIELTISATSGKRFVLFGVNAIYPEITLDPASYNFENVRAGLSKSQEFTITANENVTGELSASIIDDANGKYSVTDIENGKVTVTFAPGEAESGTFEAKLKVWATNALVTADLTGTAIAAAAPEITVDKNAVAFGRVNPNAEVSEDIQIGLLNIDGAVSAALSGDDEDKFELSASSFTEDGVLTITPVTTENGIFNATLTLSATDADDVVIPLSITVANKWAVTYTSNVTLTTTGGTSASNAKVKVNGEATEYSAIKAGSGGSKGEVVITVPAKTKKLHVHAAAWNESGSTDITLSITGAATIPSELSLVRDAGISGTSTTYTLANSPISQYYEISIPDSETPTALTFGTNAGNKRFVIYGVNEEGGIHELPDGTTNASTLPEEINLLVGDGSVLNVNTDKIMNNLIVEAGGKVSGASNLEVKDLTIKTSLGIVDGETETETGGKSIEITNPDNVLANGEVWIEIELTQETQASAGWYAFSVPFRVDAMNGVYYQNSKLQNEVGYAIMSYHGDIRATGEYGWKKFRGIMEPGVFYVITVGNTDYKTLRFKKVADSKLFNDNDVLVGDDKNQMNVNAYTYSGEGTSTDAGWNGLGNPYLAPAHVSGVDLQLYDHALNRFWQYESNNVNMMVGRAFFYQYQSSSSITINMSDEGIALAPARAMSSIEQTTFKVYLRNEAGRLEDKVFLRTSEDATNDYESGRDLAKMSMGNAKCAQMWIPAYGTQLCAADFPLVNNKVTYPLIINTLAAGTYTISAAETSENATLYLTKNGRIYWNLTMGACELDLNQGQNNEYGLVLRAEVPAVTTGIENGELLNGENGVQKVVIDEHVYILRGGEMYGIDGKAVK